MTIRRSTTAELFADNRAAHYANHHIKYDGLLFEDTQLKTIFLIFSGYLKNVIKASVKNWLGTADSHANQQYIPPQGSNYANGYTLGRTYRY